MTIDHADLTNCISALTIDAVEAAQSGHPGAPMGMADAATVLARRHLKFDASAPHWADRDRLVLSNGHASMLLYALLHLTGVEAVTLEALRNFRQIGSATAGHPEFGHLPGIETTTGPLGQGFAAAVGMAMTERLLRAEFGEQAVDHHTYVLLGDGCLQEGIGQEALSLAGHLGLGKLIVLYDDNGITIDGPTDVSFSEDVPARFAACGWHIQQCDGHDPDALDAAIGAARANTDKPSMVAMKTTIGFGAPTKAGTAASHGAPLGAEEAAGAKHALDWHAPAFTIPAELAAKWKAIGARGADARLAWEQRIDAMPPAQRREFLRRMAGELPDGFEPAFDSARRALLSAPQNVATRKAGQMTLDALAAALPELVGGSADLTGSNLTRVPAVEPLYTRDAPGRYIGYGVREFAMAAAMNGMGNHGGIIPYGGTFLVFSDYARNAIRLAALMKQGTIFVMTHDSIGLGEDGPTHQPVEHLAALRAIPGLNVYRPADSVETLECWALAIRHRHAPSVIVLSRQATPQLRHEATKENPCERGAYIIRRVGSGDDLALLATGTEVAIAVAAAEVLSAEHGIGVRVVSMPCWEHFEDQSATERAAVLGQAPRLAIEAAGKFGWTRYVDDERDVIGLDGFGASGPGPALYEHFGITADAIIQRARTRLRL